MPRSIEEIKAEIARIDEKFESATGWGSWMSGVSSWRAELVSEARKLGVEIESKYERKVGGVVKHD